MFEKTTGVFFDRVHRFGRRSTNRPRPIIAKFTSFKQKQYVIENSSKFSSSPINVSEDYSRPTVAIRRSLFDSAKNVKDKCQSIIKTRVQYKRLVVTYLNSDSDKTFVRSFALKDIQERPNDWFVPEKRK